jgi:hypothetical protein
MITMEKKLFGLLVFLFCTALYIRAQVNIGTIDPPHEAAVLDLSQKETGATPKGLLLPRVDLLNVSVFQLPGNGDSEEEKNAAGMTIYNLNITGTVGGTGEGIYVWDGKKWRPMKQCVPGVWDTPVTGPSGATYRVYCFNGGVGCWWIDFSKEGSVGTNGTKTFPGNYTPPAKEGEYGYYYNVTSISDTTAVDGACPGDWHVPDLTEYEKLDSLLNNCPSAFDIFIQGGYNGWIVTAGDGEHHAVGEHDFREKGCFLIKKADGDCFAIGAYGGTPQLYIEEYITDRHTSGASAGVRCVKDPPSP